MVLRDGFAENMRSGNVHTNPFENGEPASKGEEKRQAAVDTDLAATHPHLVPLWSKKNKLSPKEVTAGSHRKVLWVCDEGHEWEAAVFTAAYISSGCPYCAGKRAIPGKTDLQTLRPDLLSEWDHEKNKANPSNTLPSSHDKVWWKCEKGHSWQAAVFSRTRENAAGCPYCTGRLVLPGFNDLATLRPNIAEEWYQTLNGELKPENVSPGSNKKAWWICREGHVWKAAIYSRTRKRGSGCPVCTGTVMTKEQPVIKIVRPAAYSSVHIGLNQL